MSDLIKPQSYYSKEAYCSTRTPEQADAPPRKLLHKLIGTRLPWGRTQDVLPDNILQDPKPKSMRFWEEAAREKAEAIANGTYVTPPLAHLNLHFKHNHEVIQHAQLPLHSHFWIYLKVCGLWGAVVIAPILMLTHLSVIYTLSTPAWELTKDLALNVYSWFLGIPLFFGTIGHIVVTYFPRIWFRAPKGPLWELNRRTGLVTVFDYKDFKKTGIIGEKTAPFYEFDAYIVTSPDRQGLPMNGLSLVHRYSDIGMHLNDIIAVDNTIETPCALWDFLQNFMDISRPLPDVPVHEAHRHLDPVTAAHDQKTGREPRYWIDMDDDTFKAKVHEMRGRIGAIDTLRRPNLMAMHVRYVD